MSDASTIESRLELLEREMAEVRRRLSLASDPARQSWLERLKGSQQGDDDFQQVLKLGREIRSADRPSDVGGE
jgi:hypothetical protein